MFISFSFLSCIPHLSFFLSITFVLSSHSTIYVYIPHPSKNTRALYCSLIINLSALPHYSSAHHTIPPSFTFALLCFLSPLHCADSLSSNNRGHCSCTFCHYTCLLYLSQYICCLALSALSSDSSSSARPVSHRRCHPWLTFYLVTASALISLPSGFYCWVPFLEQ